MGWLIQNSNRVNVRRQVGNIKLINPITAIDLLVIVFNWNRISYWKFELIFIRLIPKLWNLFKQPEDENALVEISLLCFKQTYPFANAQMHFEMLDSVARDGLELFICIHLCKFHILVLNNQCKSLFSESSYSIDHAEQSQTFIVSNVIEILVCCCEVMRFQLSYNMIIELVIHAFLCWLMVSYDHLFWTWYFISRNRSYGRS